MRGLSVLFLIFFNGALAMSQPTRQMIAGATDHTFLKTDEHGVTLEDQEAAVSKLVDEAHQHGGYAVCVREHMVGHARRRLDELGSPVKVAAVVGFPLGDQFTTEEKTALVRRARRDGADEYDMVLRYEDFKNGNEERAYEDVVAVSQEAGDQVLKVIIETAYLNEEQKREAFALVAKAFIDSADGDGDDRPVRFLKTSTGFAKPTDGSPVGATLEDVAAMHAVSRGRFGIKPAGGVSTYEDAVKFFEAAGAPTTADGKRIDPLKFRIGSSSLLLQLVSDEADGEKDY